MKDKLMIFDLDGTLFDTKEVNYMAYSQALKEAGCEATMDYRYYCDFCNGNSYKTFLPEIVPGLDKEKMSEIHEYKKRAYPRYLDYARVNETLVNLIRTCRENYHMCIVTTASKKNTEDILKRFELMDMFDFILTQEDVVLTKPNPEGFLLAMKKANVEKKNTLIFEDSKVGLEAAKQSGADYVQVYGFN